MAFDGRVLLNYDGEALAVRTQMSDPRSQRFVRSYLKTKHLVLLVELGRHGSIMHAAQAANLTQPAASKLLGELEHALGVPLFERLPRGVEPTSYGRRWPKWMPPTRKWSNCSPACAAGSRWARS